MEKTSERRKKPYIFTALVIASVIAHGIINTFQTPPEAIMLGTYAEGILLYDLSYVLPSITILSGLFIFREQLRNYLGTEKFRFLTVLIITLSLTGFKTQTVYKENWHEKKDFEQVQWGGTDPKIHFYSDWEYDHALLIFKVRSMDERQLKLEVDSNDFKTIDVKPLESKYTRFIDVEPGLNTISFETNSSCDIMGEHNNNDDTRCVTFGVRAMSVAQPLNSRLYLGKNVTKEDFGYQISGDGELFVYGNGNYSIHMNGRSAGDEQRLTLTEEGEKIFTTRIDGFGSTLSTPYREINGFKRIEIDKCDDCKELKLSNLELELLEDQADDFVYDFGSNWYRKAEKEDYKWSYGNSSIYVYNYEDEVLTRKIWVEGKSFGKDRNITYEWNGEELGTKHVFATDYKPAWKHRGTLYVPDNYPPENKIGKEVHIDNKYGFDVRLKPGENVLRIKSDSNCLEFSEVNNNSDIRCGFYGLKNLYLTEP